MSTPSFLLSELLMALGTTRMAIESKKRQLVDLPSYTSASVFALFDTEGKGHISLANLYDYLKLRYIFPTEAELFSLFK
jgi:Ca2+-binding EF-hand superfamily protein